MRVILMQSVLFFSAERRVFFTYFQYFAANWILYNGVIIAHYPFSSATLQHTIADQFVPEKYPNYGNFMICNNVKRLTSNNYILKKENSNTSLLAYWCLPN